MLDKSVKVLVDKFGKPGDVEPGDVFITNDPYYGGVTHLNDLVVAMPVFAGEKLIAWTANIAHNSDVGGKSPGSLSADATDIFQEGLRLPAIKMISKGEPIAGIFDIITVNSRMPDFLRGDLWAAIASVRIGARRLTEQMVYQATHDALTHLPNLSLLRDRLRHAIARAQRTGQNLALLFVDLDHFKKVNEGLGFAPGRPGGGLRAETGENPGVPLSD